MNALPTSNSEADLRLRYNPSSDFRRYSTRTSRRGHGSRIASALFVSMSAVSALDLYLLARSIPHL